MHTSRALAAVLTTAALAAPTAATARPEPILPPTPTAHPSQTPQDLSSPDARDAAKGRYAGQVRSHGNTKVYVQPDQIAPAAEQAAARSGSPSAQPSTPAPAIAVSGGHSGIDWGTLAIGIAGSMLAFSGIAALTTRRNRRQRAVHAAH